MKETSKTVKLTRIKKNPDNPRVIRDEKFAQLRENLRKFPKLLELRPIVIKSWDDAIIIGGNMRYEGLKAEGYTEVPETWIKTAADFTAEELEAFIILDNIPFGEWDFDILANNFDFETLQSYGLDIPDFSALQNIDIDEFFAKDEGVTETLTEKFTIVLEYTPEEGARVKEALSKINPSAEQAVWQLLGLAK